MALSIASFVLPKLTEDGKIKPRQRFMPGMLVAVTTHRYPVHPATMPRGNHWAKLIERSDSGYWIVQWLGSRVNYATSNGDRYREKYIVATRACKLIHPDPDHGSHTFMVKARLTAMYANAAASMRSAASRMLATSLAQGNASMTENQRYRKLMNVVGRKVYQNGIHHHYYKNEVTSYLNHVKKCKEWGANLGRLMAMGDWAAAYRLIEGSMTHIYNSGKLREKITAKLAEAGLRRCACGHFEQVANVHTLWSRYDPSYTACDECFDRMDVHTALTYDGSEVQVDLNNTRVYHHGDGTVRIYPEPSLIDGYHSSKQYFTAPMLNPDGSKYKGLCLGMELEFVRSGNSGSRDENTVVRNMYADMERALPLHKRGVASRYCAFERDGSVDFEMVTGYGGLATHRTAIVAMFGKNQYARDLRSHDGGRCGIHVHLDKPESLTHAMKLTRFWNDTATADLVKAIARRYDAGARYAAVVPDKMKSAIEQRQVASRTRGRSGSRRRIMREAMRNINASRYELLNFQNENTVEVRAFRGSLRHQTIIACLEFAYFTWFYSRDTPAHRLCVEGFLSYISRPENRSDSRYLREYLKGKGFDVWVAKPPKKVLREVQIEEVADMDTDADPYEVNRMPGVIDAEYTPNDPTPPVIGVDAHAVTTITYLGETRRCTEYAAVTLRSCTVARQIEVFNACPPDVRANWPFATRRAA